MVNKDSIIVLPADPDDPEDFDVSLAGLERSDLARGLRRLRTQLGLTPEEFARRYELPPEEYSLYEQARLAPPPAVMAYLRVILREPDVVARAVAA